MPETEIAKFILRTDGVQVVSPPLEGAEGGDYRIILEGTMRSRYNGQEFDAVYRFPTEGREPELHDYLQWTPRRPELEQSDFARHRYVFRVPKGWEMTGQSVGVRVDLDRFVEQFLITPSEARQSLSGEIQVTVRRTPIPVPFPWGAVTGLGIAATLTVGGVGVILRRRMALQGLPVVVQTQLGSIEQKFRTAQAAARRRPQGRLSLEERLRTVRMGAWSLARQIQALQKTRQVVGRAPLEQDILRLESRLTTLSDAMAHQEAEVTLQEKRKALALLDGLEQAEARCQLRLTKIEAILDTACLTLMQPPSPTPLPNLPTAEDRLRTELEAEVAAIQEVEREARLLSLPA